MQLSNITNCNQINSMIWYNAIKGWENMYVETFASRLKKARENTGFTQREVEKETGIKQSTLAGYEIGRTQPDIETIGILAEFYNISVDWLIGLEREKKS